LEIAEGGYATMRNDEGNGDYRNNHRYFLDDDFDFFAGDDFYHAPAIVDQLIAPLPQDNGFVIGNHNNDYIDCNDSCFSCNCN
jgi:hypothetical protein